MEVQEATNLVNHNMAFWKGWQFYAMPYEGTQIFVAASIETVDTSYPDKDGVCRSQPITLRDGFTVDVAGLDVQGLCHRIIENAAEFHEHEDREALKVRQPDGSWVAPLHPHTDEGERGWAKYQLASFTALISETA